MEPVELHTEYAPAERAGEATVESQYALLQSLTPNQRLFNAIPVIALILNRERQIVFANRALLEFVRATETRELYGLRPGEVLECIHAQECPGGCGTTEYCRVCGLLEAVLTSRLGGAAEETCRITRRTAYGEESAEWQVWATPVEVGGQRFTMLCAIDLSDRVRRAALERVFFQEVLGGAAEVEKLAQELGPAGSAEERAALVQAIAAASGRLSAAVAKQRELAAAESGELEVKRDPLSSLGLLRELETAPGLRFQIDPKAEDVAFTSDAALVRRVLACMLENALEASGPQQPVTAGCRRAGEEVEFWVHNTGHMPKQVRLQIFQRSFTTRGPGRGFGTYTMKLLSERYLGGSVTFRSTLAEGTVFVARYPLAAA